MNKGKGSAHQAACLNNLRQLSIANVMYAGDHHDQSVPLIDLRRDQSTELWMANPEFRAAIGYSQSYRPGPPPSIPAPISTPAISLIAT